MLTFVSSTASYTRYMITCEMMYFCVKQDGWKVVSEGSWVMNIAEARDGVCSEGQSDAVLKPAFCYCFVNICQVDILQNMWGAAVQLFAGRHLDFASFSCLVVLNAP